MTARPPVAALTRDQRLMLTLLCKASLPTWALSGFMKPEAMQTFNDLHHAGLVTLSADFNAYSISDAGRAALLNGHGLSFFDLCYRSDESEEYTW